MTILAKALMISVFAATAVTPASVSAQNSMADQRRHDDRANTGFSTRRDTTGADREGGYIRYTMSHSGNTRSARSSDEAERQFRRGNDAYAAGQYGSACVSFRHARNLFARVDDTQMKEVSSSLANDACAMARANTSGPARAYRSG